MALNSYVHAYRRYIIVALCLLLCFLLLEGFRIYGDQWSISQGLPSTTFRKPSRPEPPQIDPADKAKIHAFPIHGEPLPFGAKINGLDDWMDDVPNEKPNEKPNDGPNDGLIDEPNDEPNETDDVNAVKTSRLHFILPANDENEMFCAVVAAALANRYPVPHVVGWSGEGEFNAKETHTAKLRTVYRYLQTLPYGGEDDDLIIVGDGHDVMAQLPADIMVERYFELVAAADATLADRYGLTVEEARSRGLRQTLFWGADKMCWPPLYDEPQCKDTPRPPMPYHILGPHTDDGSHLYRTARFMNSGSVIGPIGDLRRYISAGIDLLEETFDPDFKWRDSDQVYLSRLWGKQELARTEQTDTGPLSMEENMEGSEYHTAIDYTSSFVQTGCHYDRWRHRLRYDQPDHTATMDTDTFDRGDDFQPYPIQMPTSVFKSLAQLFESIPGLADDKSAREWVSGLPLDTNIVSETIYAFYHATCSKAFLLDEFRQFWFHPYLYALMKSAFNYFAEEERPISPKVIDGRHWVSITAYPGQANEEELGGIFTDFEEQEFIPYTELCAEFLDILEAA